MGLQFLQKRKVYIIFCHLLIRKKKTIKLFKIGVKFPRKKKKTVKTENIKFSCIVKVHDN